MKTDEIRDVIGMMSPATLASFLADLRAESSSETVIKLANAATDALEAIVGAKAADRMIEGLWRNRSK